jgi:quercetin dioxygenase-like cupin family protein
MKHTHTSKTDKLVLRPPWMMVDHGAFNALTQGADWRKKLIRLDEALAKLPQVPMLLKHYFSRGVYARELFIAKGTAITGRIHKFSQINVMLSGDISVLTENGIERLSTSGTVFESPAGTKRAGYAHEDTRWLTICGTDTTDTTQVEDELTVKTYSEFDAWCQTYLSLEA